MSRTRLSRRFAILAALLLSAAAMANDAPLRLACVGDSITAGAAARVDGKDRSYPAQLSEMLGPAYAVRNFGLGGGTLLAKGDKPWSKARECQAAKDFQPQVVVLMLGTNDSKPQNWAHEADFSADYRALVAGFAGLPSKPRIILCTPIPAFPGQWGIDAGRIREGVVPRVKALAEELKLQLIDLHSVFADKAGLLRDTVHPTPEGYTLIAQTVAAALRSPPGSSKSDPAATSGPAPTAGPGLPDPLLSRAGKPVTDAKSWREQRRPEILELFRANVYGRAPVGRPADEGFAIQDSVDAMDGKAVRKRVEITFSGPGGKGRIRLLAFIPKAARPAPGFLLICHREPENIDPSREKKLPFWPAEEIVARGYAAITFDVSDCDPDRFDQFKDGVHGIFDARPRPADAWGSIGVWAWGASRAMDYLASDKDFAPDRIAVIGHSRGGKAALWAGAQDERFAMVISNDSGCTGAALARGSTGETVQKINKTFPHWFCATYKTYADRVEALPVDQHMLLALVAPRLLYVASASQDANADPNAEFRSCVEAGPVFRLLGGSGVAADAMPAVDSPVHAGGIGYHIRSGEHDLKLADWQHYLDFADAKWGRAK